MILYRLESDRMRFLGFFLFRLHSRFRCAALRDWASRGVCLDTRLLGRQYGNFRLLERVERPHLTRFGSWHTSIHRSANQREMLCRFRDRFRDRDRDRDRFRERLGREYVPPLRLYSRTSQPLA